MDETGGSPCGTEGSTTRGDVGCTIEITEARDVCEADMDDEPAFGAPKGAAATEVPLAKKPSHLGLCSPVGNKRNFSESFPI